MVFKPGQGGHGRPKGARNRFDAFAYACALAHVQHKIGTPAPAEFAGTSLWAAFEVTLAEDAEAYLARVISMLPKSINLESSLSSMEDDEIDTLLTQLRERAIEARTPSSPMLLEAPKVMNGSHQPD